MKHLIDYKYVESTSEKMEKLQANIFGNILGVGLLLVLGTFLLLFRVFHLTRGHCIIGHSRNTHLSNPTWNSNPLSPA